MFITNLFYQYLKSFDDTTCLVFLSCLGYSPSRGSPTSLLIFRFDRRLKTFRLRLESSPSIHSYLVESSSLTIHFIPRTKGDPWIWVSSLLKFVELGVRLVLLPLHPPVALLDIPTWWYMPDAFPGRRLNVCRLMAAA